MGFSISQSLYFGSVLQFFINCYYSNGMKQMSNQWSTSCDHFLDNSSYPIKSCRLSHQSVMAGKYRKAYGLQVKPRLKVLLSVKNLYFLVV